MRTPATLMMICALSLPAAADEDEARQQMLERGFEKMLTGATLEGYFTDDAKPVEDQPLSRDRYDIESVKKASGNLWIFKTRIRYGDRDVTLPIPLRVEWAGDTPVVTLTDMAIPPLGTFTARVLFYRGQYAGTWSGGDHGGQMFGRIIEADKPVVVAPFSESPHWPQYRGYRAQGVVEGHPLPEEWDAESGEGVAWKTEVPGLSHSSPVIWGDRIFLTTAVKEGDPAELKVGLYGDIGSVEDDSPRSMRVLAFDKHSGEMIWEREAFHGVPAIKRHPKGSHAACSPVTDGEHVVAFFASEGLYCYDMDGELLWEKDFGVLDAGFFMVKSAQWGSASSPIIHDGRLILQVDVQENSFLCALDVATGEEIWRTDRDEVPTWSTPTIVEYEDRTQIVCNGFKHIGGYDFESGEELWMLEGGGDIPVPTPITAGDLIFITNAHGRMAPIYAIHASAEGELEMDPEDCAFMAWSSPRYGNYMQTPIAYGEYLYLCNDTGVFYCYELDTGEQVYRHRVGGGRDGFTASVVAGDGKIYITSEGGMVYVVKAGPEFELVGYNDMDDLCMATPAISEGVLYVRTRSHLVAIPGPGNPN